LIRTFGIIKDSVQIYCDNQSVIHLAKDHRYYRQTKHTDVRNLGYVSGLQWKRLLILIKINTKKNLADMMTKTIPVEKFRASLNFINVLPK